MARASRCPQVPAGAATPGRDLGVFCQVAGCTPTCGVYCSEGVPGGELIVLGACT